MDEPKMFTFPPYLTLGNAHAYTFSYIVNTITSELLFVLDLVLPQIHISKNLKYSVSIGNGASEL